MQQRSRFRTISATFAAVGAVVLGAAAAGAAPAARATSSVRSAAATHCRYQPHFPRRVAIGQDSQNVIGRLTVTGRGCEHSSIVDVSLKHETDTVGYTWYSWINPHRDNETFDAQTLVPGWYGTHNSGTCNAKTPTGGNYSCSVGNARSLVKLAGRVRLSGHRSGNAIAFHVVSLRYKWLTGFVRYTDRVAIHRLSGNTWRTIHRAIARNGSYSWTYTDRRPASYRAVAASTVKTFAATSRTIKR